MLLVFLQIDARVTLESRFIFTWLVAGLVPCVIMCVGDIDFCYQASPAFAILPFHEPCV